MIESTDAQKMLATISQNLAGVSKNQANFAKLPDTFWGYFARGHDAKARFGVIVTYSEKESDVDELISMYEKWVSKQEKK